eukprot:g77.t1
MCALQAVFFFEIFCFFLLLVSFVDGAKFHKHVAGPGCQRWAQTSNCDGSGAREPLKDKACDDLIRSGNSGYCLCDDGRKAGVSNCIHPEFRCVDKCAALGETVSGLCKHFTPTKSCHPQGPMNSSLGRLDCFHEIPRSMSGYCTCKNGAVKHAVGCHHEPFTCAEECTKHFIHTIPEHECTSNFDEESDTSQTIPLIEREALARAEAERERIRRLEEKAAEEAKKRAEAEAKQKAEEARRKAQAEANIRATAARAKEKAALAAAKVKEEGFTDSETKEVVPPPPPRPPVSSSSSPSSEESTAKEPKDEKGNIRAQKKS